MTKLFVFSDSHGKTDRLHRLVARLEGDYFIHCGDFGMDLQGNNVFHVRGNCDPWSKAPLEVLLQIEERTIWITHGHKQRIKSGLHSLLYGAQEKGADIVLFGHSHEMTAVEEQGVLLLNPGSISLPPPGQPASYLELTIDGREVDYRFHTLD